MSEDFVKKEFYCDSVDLKELVLDDDDAAVDQKTSSEDIMEYQSIVDRKLDEIDNEILIFYNFVRSTYRLKFPELESLVPHPIEYARVVKKIGNETDIASLDLEGLLFPAIIVAVSITLSTTTGKKLPEDVLQKIVESCDRILALDARKKQVVGWLTTQMGYIAPNLSALVGSRVAAKLVAAAGGLSQLVNMPSCNIQSLGDRRKHNHLTSRRFGGGGGFVEETEIFQSTPPCLRMRACRLLANKSIMAARVDFARTDPTGNKGKILEDEIRKNIEKWQERPPAKQRKALPVPRVFESKKKRGGRRLRKRKERYGLTEMRKLANRMAFGVIEDSSLGDGLGEGYGLMFSKVRLAIGPSKLVANKFSRKHQSGSSGGGRAISDFTSSMQLDNPLGQAQHIGGRTSTYFAETGTFSKILNKM